MKKKIIGISIILTIVACSLFFVSCGTKNGTYEDLENLKNQYGESCVENAKRFFTESEDFTVEYECVILNKKDTAENLKLYKFSPEINIESVTGGIFVKCAIKLNGSEEPVNVVYYNYGIMFNEKQKNDYVVGTDYNEEKWALERVKDTPNIVFEFNMETTTQGKV